MDLGRVVINVSGACVLEALDALKRLPDSVIQDNPREIIVSWNDVLTGPVLSVFYRDTADYTNIKFTPPVDSNNIQSNTDTIIFDYQGSVYTLQKKFSHTPSHETSG